MDDYAAAQLRARQVVEETGLSLAELSALPTDEYARLTGRPTPAQAALAALAAEREQAAPAAPQSAPQAPADEPKGIDLAGMTMSQYAALRGQLGVGGREYGRGIFDSVGSQSETYVNAVRAQSGRGALSNANVQEAPRLEGRYVNHDQQRDTRPAAQRFSTPGNAVNL